MLSICSAFTDQIKMFKSKATGQFGTKFHVVSLLKNYGYVTDGTETSIYGKIVLKFNPHKPKD